MKLLPRLSGKISRFTRNFRPSRPLHVLGPSIAARFNPMYMPPVWRASGTKYSRVESSHRLQQGRATRGWRTVGGWFRRQHRKRVKDAVQACRERDGRYRSVWDVESARGNLVITSRVLVTGCQWQPTRVFASANIGPLYRSSFNPRHSVSLQNMLHRRTARSAATGNRYNRLVVCGARTIKRRTHCRTGVSAR